MTYQLSKKVPNITIKGRKNGEWIEHNTHDLFHEKKVVVFGLPGAFTPTCSSTHLPRYKELSGAFFKEGIDHIICVSVNDPFVMEAWQKEQSANDIIFLADGNAEFTEAIGMLTDKSSLNFGKRSWRYSMFVDNMNIVKGFVEANVEGDPFDLSDADTMLNYINAEAELPDVITMFTKIGCDYCQKAKQLFKERGLSFEEFKIGHGASMSSLANVTGRSSLPQIYINQKHIGGFEDLRNHLNSV